MKEKFAVYLLWPFKKKIIFWLGTGINAPDFTVLTIWIVKSAEKCNFSWLLESVLSWSQDLILFLSSHSPWKKESKAETVEGLKSFGAKKRVKCHLIEHVLFLNLSKSWGGGNWTPLKPPISTGPAHERKNQESWPHIIRGWGWHGSLHHRSMWLLWITFGSNP